MWHWQRRNGHNCFIKWSKITAISCAGHGIIGMIFFFCGHQQPVIAFNSMALKKREEKGGLGVVMVAIKRQTISPIEHGGKAGTCQKTIRIQKGKNKQHNKIGTATKASVSKMRIQDQKSSVGVSTDRSSVSKPVLASTKKCKQSVAQVPLSKVSNLKSRALRVPDSKVSDHKGVLMPAPLLSAVPVAPVAPVKSIKEKCMHEKRVHEKIVSKKCILKKAAETVESKLLLPEMKDQWLSDSTYDDKTLMVVEKGKLEEQAVQALPSCYDQLRHALARRWQPPVGVIPQKECIVQIQVPDNGHVKVIEIMQSSGVLMFDVSVRSACYVYEWPVWARNKQLTITFI